MLMERCYEKHTTLVRQTILSVKDGDNAQTCTIKERPGNTRLPIVDWVPNWSEAKTPHVRDAMLSEGPYCRYPLEATMMGHEVIAKQGKH